MRKTIFLIAALVALAIPAAASAGSGLGSTAMKHQLSMYKVEKNLVIDADDHEELDVACNSGDLVMDGMWRVDDVQFNAQLHDEGPWGPWDKYNGVDVYESDSNGAGAWSFSLYNHSEEPAQTKVWITCLANPTAAAEPDKHTHSFEPTTVHEWAYTLDANSVADDLKAGGEDCDKTAGEIAVAPGFRVEDGATVKPFKVWPNNTYYLNGWRLGFYVPNDDPVVHTSVRCLKLLTTRAGANNHRHELKVKFRDDGDGTITANKTMAVKQDCGEQEKALVAAFDVRRTNSWGPAYADHALWFLGMEPQIKSRVFHIQNHTGTDQTADIGAICFNDRTGARKR